MKNFLKAALIIVLSMLLSTAIVTVNAELPAPDTSSPYFQIESKSANMGDEVELSVSAENNPGFWSAKLTITYDEGLYLIKENSVPFVNFSENVSSKISVDTNYSMSKLTVLLVSNTLSDITENGVLFSIKIKVDDDAVTGDYNVSFTDYSSSNFINSNGEKVGFTFGNGVISVNGKNLSEVSDEVTYDYSFDAVDCSPTAPSGGSLGKYSQTDISPEMTISNFMPSESGQYVEYTLSGLPAGEYDLYIFSRDYTTRGVFDVYVDGTLLDNISFIATSLKMTTKNVGSFKLDQEKDVTIRFVAGETLNSMYLAGFYLNKDRPKFLYEEKTESIYTMDEGSRPSVYGVTKDCPNTSEFTSISNNNVLSFARLSGTVTLINHSVYFKLPDDIFTKYDNLISLSISIRTDYGSFYSHNSGFNRIYMSSYPTESPNSKNAIKVAGSSTYKFTTTPTVLTVDLTSDAGKYIVNNDYKYFNIINSVESNNGNSYNYLYIDDVVLTYNMKTTGNIVNIDGIKEEIVPIGSFYTLPDEEDVVAYKDEVGNFYPCGSEVEITKNTYFTSVKLSLKTLSSASMRFSANYDNRASGIRFYTELDQDVVSELRDAGATVNFGTLITPESYFADKSLTDLKHDVDFGKTTNYIDVKYTSLNYFSSTDFNGIVGSITNLKDDHALWNFVGRGYATVTINGNTKTVYAEGKDELPKRSICYISCMIKQDTDYYSTLNEYAKSLVDYYYKIYCDSNFIKDPYGKDKFF